MQPEYMLLCEWWTYKCKNIAVLFIYMPGSVWRREMQMCLSTSAAAEQHKFSDSQSLRQIFPRTFQVVRCLIE